MKKINFVSGLLMVLSIQSLDVQENETFYYSKTIEGTFEEVIDKTKTVFKE